jgi:protein-tyrosine kinase
MSKYFELLLQAESQGRQREFSNTTAAERPRWEASAEAAAALAPIRHTDPLWEQVAMLVRHLFLLSSGVRAAVLAGVEPGDGSTWMTVQCARMLAASVQGSVCVIDGNLRTPALHDRFATAKAPGLSDALVQSGGVRRFAHQVPQIRNLWLVPAGSASGAGAQTAGAENLASRITELRAEFDYLLIDSPPLHLYGDAIMLGKSADGVALVIAEQGTHRESARHAVQELSKANVHLLGAVLNKRTFPIPKKIYDKI